LADKLRYIGSKTQLLDQIAMVVHRDSKENIKNKIFCDIFSGTGTVGRHFKNDFTIYSNDSLYFSYVLQRATIGINNLPSFTKLINKIGVNPFTYFTTIDVKKFNFLNEPFFFKNYAPSPECTRQYFTIENALLIDAIRQSIEYWKQTDLISEDEYFFLIGGLVETVPSVSNIAGTYGAFLKHWDSRTSKRIEPVKFQVFDNNKINQCFNKDANELIKEIKGDILYIDPPYNQRQYFSNYHILETVAKYDNPPIKGVTGTRIENNIRGHGLSSNYCKKGKVFAVLNDLIKNANFEHIVLSYSTDGILSEDEIISILERHCNKTSLQIQRIPYRKYKRKISETETPLTELIFSIKK
jgi:adenine-specific DNA-methyltransferase